MMNEQEKCQMLQDVMSTAFPWGKWNVTQLQDGGYAAASVVIVRIGDGPVWSQRCEDAVAAMRDLLVQGER